LNKKQSQKIYLGHWVENHQTGDHSWSEDLYQILEISKKNIAASFDTLLSFVHVDDKKTLNNTYKKALKEKSGFEINHKLVLENGSIKTVNQKCFTNYDIDGNAIQSIGIIHDNSDSESTKKDLQISEEKFRSVFENAPIAILLINNKLKPTLLNKQFCKLLGYTEEELKKLNIKAFTDQDDFENNALLFDKLFKGLINSFTISKRYIRKDKNKIWVKVTVSAIVNSHGKTNEAIAMAQNISAEKEATEALVKSEYKYRTLIENANDGIGLFTLDMKPIIYNTSLYQTLGYTLTEYLSIDHSKYELYCPSDQKSAAQAISKVQNNEKVRIEKKLRKKDGSYSHFSISYIPVIHEEQPAILIFRRDISQRKAAEEQSEEYKLFLETIMENLPVSLFAKTTPDFKYLYWNKSMELMTGIAAEKAIGSADYEIFHSKKLVENLQAEDNKVLKTKQRIEKEHVFTNIIGEDKQMQTIKTLHIPPTGNPIILGISVDVTKLKSIEKQVEQSDQLLKEAQKITKLGYWEYDPKKDLIFDNKENREIFGTTSLPYFLNSKQLLEIVLQADHSVLEKAFNDCISKKQVGEGIIRIQVKDKIKHISINYKPILDNSNEIVKLRGTSLDITRIRESEKALRESENRLKQAEHIAKVGYWNYDYIQNKTQFSDEVSIILEIEILTENPQFSQLFGSVHPDDKIATAAVFHKSKGSAEPFDFDFRILTSSNTVKFIKAKGTFVKNQQGDLIRSIGTFQDITELKQKQIELEKYSNHLKSIQQLSKTGYIEFELNKKLVKFSEELHSILNTKQKLKSISEFNNFIFHKDLDRVKQVIQTTLNNKNTHNIQYRIKLEDGTIKTVNEICEVKKHTNPLRYSVTRIIQDISHIEEKEFALSKSKIQLNQAVQTSFIGIWEYNIETDKYSFSKEVIDILNIPSNNKNITLKQVIEQIHPEDRYSVKKVYSKSFKNKQNYNLTYRIIPFDKNEIKYIKDTGRFIQNKDSDWLISGTISDISEVRKTKQKLNETKEILDTIVENCPNALAIIQNKKTVFSNSNWSNLFNSTEIQIEDIKTESNNTLLNMAADKLGKLKDITLILPDETKIKADLFLNNISFKNKSATLIQLVTKK